MCIRDRKETLDLVRTELEARDDELRRATATEAMLRKRLAEEAQRYVVAKSKAKAELHDDEAIAMRAQLQAALEERDDAVQEAKAAGAALRTATQVAAVAGGELAAARSLVDEQRRAGAAALQKTTVEHDAACKALGDCLLYTSPSPRDQRGSRMPSSA